MPVAQAGTAVDLVLMVYGTLSHLISNDDALASFTAAAASLTPKGVFVVEMQHPTDLFDGVLACGDTWEVKRERCRCMFGPAAARVSVTSLPPVAVNPLVEAVPCRRALPGNPMQVRQWLSPAARERDQVEDTPFGHLLVTYGSEDQFTELDPLTQVSRQPKLLNSWPHHLYKFTDLLRPCKWAPAHLRWPL